MTSLGKLACLVAALLPTVLSAQERQDSVATLVSAQSMSLIEQGGVSYRKVIGPARFLHNNTYLICDTALWNVNRSVIEAIGHVKILQDKTTLTSDNLTYFIDTDLAQFRGTLVQLEDKDHNILRTTYLDYNTRDSVAVFQKGASMRDKDGQVIESRTGTYDSKVSTFTFTDNVNMFTDSVFIKTSRLVYQSDLNLATFGYFTNAWKDDDMLSANAGWYDRGRDLFFFTNAVHGLTPDKEAWADSLYFNRTLMDLEMLGNVQLVDTVRHATAVAGRIVYTDSVSLVRMMRDPAVIGISDPETHPEDTVYVGADTLRYQGIPRFQLSKGQLKASQTRLDNLQQDAVAAYRQKAREAAAAAAEEAAQNDPETRLKREAEERRAALQGKAGPELSGKKDAPPGPDAGAAGGNGDPGGRKAKGGAAAPAQPAADGKNGSGSQAPPAVAAADSLTAVPDSLAATKEALTAVPDSLASAKEPLTAASDSLASAKEPLTAASESLPPAGDFRAEADLSADTDALAEAAAPSPADSTATEVQDSTRIHFLTGISRVRLFRNDMQIVCDSLVYSDLDSLVRLYRSPVIWNEIRRQYSADSLIAVVADNRLQKADLLSNAFIIIEEAEQCYDQIRGSEMIAYFDSTSALTRFDALGDASMLFYLKEDSTFATVNKSQAKMMYALFKEGNIDRLWYFDQPTSDVIPLAQLKKEDRILKGFEWQPEKRPKGPGDIVRWTVRPSERNRYSQRERARFDETEKYFPGYMQSVYEGIASEKVRKREQQREREAARQAGPDTLGLPGGMPADSLAMRGDSLQVRRDPLSAGPDSLKAGLDSLAGAAPVDSLAAKGGQKDSLSAALSDSLQAAEQPDPQALKKAEKEAERRRREAERLRKQAEREARWARLDSLDAAKAQAKAEKKAVRERAKKRAALERAAREEARDRARLERYKARYEKKKARQEASKAAALRRKAGKEAEQEDGVTMDNPILQRDGKDLEMVR